MAYAFRSYSSNSVASPSNILISGFSPLSGSLLIVSVQMLIAQLGAQTVYDSGGGGNTYNIIGNTPASASTKTIVTYYAQNCIGGPFNLNAHTNSNNAISAVLIQEFTGIAPTGALLASTSAEVSAPGSGTNALTTGNASSISTVPAMVWGIENDETSSANACSAGTGFTQRNQVWGTSGGAAIPIDQRVIVGGSYAANWTVPSGAASDVFETFVAIFAEAPNAAAIAWTT